MTGISNAKLLAALKLVDGLRDLLGKDIGKHIKQLGVAATAYEKAAAAATEAKVIEAREAAVNAREKALDTRERELDGRADRLREAVAV